MRQMATSMAIGIRVWPSIIVVLSVFSVSLAAALSQTYCSSQNTGADFAEVTSLYQSNGLCINTCQADYAFAIVQYQQCWCSDYIPAETTSTGSCNENCPGFPADKCGSSSAGLFGYIALSKSPSGTLGAASSSQSSSSSTEAAASSTQVVSNLSPEVAPASFSSSDPASSPTSTAAASQPLPTTLFGFVLPSSKYISTAEISSLTPLLTSSAQESSPDPSPVTVQRTVTASPSVLVSYVSITPLTSSTTTPSPVQPTSSPPTPAVQSSKPAPPIILIISPTPTTSTTSTSSSSETSSETPSETPSETWTWSATPITSVITVTGQAKTLTITPTEPPAPTKQPEKSGGGGGVLSHTGKTVGLFVGVVLLLLIIAAAIIVLWFRRRRNAGATGVTSNIGDYTPQRRPSRLSQMGLVSGNQRPGGGRVVPGIQTSGLGQGSNAEKSPTDATTPLDRRTSYPRVVDQRLDPVALWNPLHDNGSHVSVRSFRDDQDYSRRMLRVANPDD